MYPLMAAAGLLVVANNLFGDLLANDDWVGMGVSSHVPLSAVPACPALLAPCGMYRCTPCTAVGAGLHTFRTTATNTLAGGLSVQLEMVCVWVWDVKQSDRGWHVRQANKSVRLGYVNYNTQLLTRGKTTNSVTSNVWFRFCIVIHSQFKKATKAISHCHTLNSYGVTSLFTIKWHPRATLGTRRVRKRYQYGTINICKSRLEVHFANTF